MRSSEKKTHKKKKQILAFLLTFSVVMLLGVAGIIIALQYGKSADTVAESGAVENMDDDESAVVYESEPEKTKTETQPDEEVADADEEEKTTADDELTADKESVDAEEAAQTDSYEEKQFYVAPKTEGEVELVFGGDICFYEEFALMGAYRQRGEDIKKCISEDLLNQIHEADIFMLNNEFAYSDRGEPIPEKAYTFRTRPENVKILYELGVDIVGLANNHIYDFGETALVDTFETLEKSKMPYIGAGRNLEEARKPAYFECGDITIAYINATQIERLETPDTKGATESTPGTFRRFNENEFTILKETIKEAKQKADFVAVYIHWGTENTDELDWAQTYQAPLIAEAGADLIIGNHTHCLQGIEKIGDVPVIYSVGNFWFNSKELDNCVVRAVVTKEGLKSFQFVPAKQANCTTSLLYGEEKTRVLNYMRSISPNVTIDENGFVY